MRIYNNNYTNGYDDVEARNLNIVPDLKVENCTSSRCVTCCAGILNTDSTFKSFLTGQNFEVENRVNCKTTHVVYLIRCKHVGCEMQYVGQTNSSVANRISSHKSHLRAGTGCKILSDHFINVHSISDMSITPIEVLNSSLDLKGREEIEELWMRKLNTIYPYGLNVRAKTCGIMDAVNEVRGSKTAIYSKFDKLVITRKHRGKGRNRINGNFNAAQFISDLIDSNSRSLIRAIQSKITQLNSAKVKLVYLESINRLNATASVWATHLLRIVKDISLYKYKDIWELSSSPKCNQFIVVKFVNKYVEDIECSRIMQVANFSQLTGTLQHLLFLSSIFHQ